MIRMQNSKYSLFTVAKLLLFSDIHKRLHGFLSQNLHIPKLFRTFAPANGSNHTCYPNSKENKGCIGGVLGD